MNKSSMVKMAVEALEQKKAEEIMVFKTQKITALFSYAVIASANSLVHARALGEDLVEKFKKNKMPCINQGGYASGAWVLLDFGDLVVHIFLPQAREFYDLEGIWKAAPRLELKDL